MPPRTRVGEIRLRELCIPFKEAFRHASAERSRTSSILVEVVSTAGVVGCGESCPRPYVTGETIDSARDFVHRHQDALREAAADLASVHDWMSAHAAEIDDNPAAWCAVEMALLDLIARDRAQPIEALLSLPPLSGRFQYSAVVGDSDAESFVRAIERYVRHGFRDFKIKLSGDLDRDRVKVAALRDGSVPRARADANNLWRNADEAIRFLKRLDYAFFAVEEPIRANQYGELMKVADALDCRIVLDESFVRVRQIDELAVSPRWLINLRVSKMGGVLRSLRIVEALKARAIDLIVGAQVGETSLLTRAALTVAHAARDRLVAQEGAFGTFLLAEDVCDPPLMFGAGGQLAVADHGALKGPGLGVAPTRC
jgi:L-alanine-DL-glutamate epimerase-like enolase superfamily enzyme